MECGWNSPEEMAVCIEFAQRWSTVMFNLIGLGTFALISLLIWLVRRLRKDLSKWEEELKQTTELKKYAEESSRHSEHLANLAIDQADKAEKKLQELTETHYLDSDELERRLITVQSELEKTTDQIDHALSLTKGGTAQFWSSPIGNRASSYERKIEESIPILMFCNQKGGVGKTTVVTNLAACFANRGERILTVDLDYQGSHSSLMQLSSNSEESNPESLIDFLFAENLDPNWTRLALKVVQDNLSYIPAWYNFEQVERRIEYQWALRRTNDDARYRLSKALLSSDIQDNYDRILIDAPPRLTLGFINGFCTSTHVFVPTVVDRLSASAVGTFARQFKELRAVLNPGIDFSGIIGTMTFLNTHDPLSLPQTAANAADDAERAAQVRLGTNAELFIRNPVIRRDKILARATENGIAYLNDSNIRPMFDALAKVIESKAPAKRPIT